MMELSITSSNLSIHNENKPTLGVISHLLPKADDGFEWMDENIITSDLDNDNNPKDKSDQNERKTNEIDNPTQNNNVGADNVDDGNDGNDEEEKEEEEIVLIYHPDYKDMIKTLPTDITEIKQQLTDLLNLWQKMVNKNRKNKDNDDSVNNDLNIDKIKSGVNALSFYINKILKKPLIEQPRKINTYNKQYRERLSNLPRIETLLTLIGYEKSGVFWTLPLLFNATNQNDDQGNRKNIHDKQINFLDSFKTVLSNLFKKSDDTLPFALTEEIQKIKQEREEKLNKKENQENTPNQQQQQEQKEEKKKRKKRI